MAGKKDKVDQKSTARPAKSQTNIQSAASHQQGVAADGASNDSDPRPDYGLKSETLQGIDYSKSKGLDKWKQDSEFRERCLKLIKEEQKNSSKGSQTLTAPSSVNLESKPASASSDATSYETTDEDSTVALPGRTLTPLSKEHLRFLSETKRRLENLSFDDETQLVGLGNVMVDVILESAEARGYNSGPRTSGVNLDCEENSKPATPMATSKYSMDDAKAVWTVNLEERMPRLYNTDS